MQSTEIRDLIISPALHVSNLYSLSADILVYGTGLIESNYETINTNGCLGYFGMDALTFKDLCKWLDLFPQKNIKNNILSTCYYMSMPIDPGVLMSNIKLAALLCRAHYLRAPEALPSASSAIDLAKFHAAYYNDAVGDAEVAKNVDIFQGIIDGTV